MSQSKFVVSFCTNCSFLETTVAEENKKKKQRSKNKAIVEIKKYQRSTDLLIKRRSFALLVREILQDLDSPSKIQRVTVEAMKALQSAAESFMINVLSSSQKVAIHSNRVTLMKKDIEFFVKLMNLKSDKE